MNNENMMKTSLESKNIVCAFINCCKSINNVYKSAKNMHQNYKYATLEDVIDSIKDDLSKNDLAFIVSTHEPKRLEPRTSKNGLINYNIEVKVTIRLIHSSGEWIEIDCFGEGQDSGDKALYKAITGAKKYGIQNLFGIATTDDPEKDDKPQSVHTKKNINEQLVAAFNDVGVSADMILSKYNVDSMENLNNENLDQLRTIFKEIKNTGKSKYDYFK